MIQVDRQATAARRFEDDRSKVLKDGREILMGWDWKDRKKELWERAGGRCEWVRNLADPFYPIDSPETARCALEGQIPAHIEPRYPKRDDRLTNLKLYCIEHDRLMEKQSWRKPRWTRREREAAHEPSQVP